MAGRRALQAAASSPILFTLIMLINDQKKRAVCETGIDPI